MLLSATVLSVVRCDQWYLGQYQLMHGPIEELTMPPKTGMSMTRVQCVPLH